MADITKCANKNCKIKETCYRYTANDGYWQSYADFNQGKVIKDKKECEHYLWARKKMEGNRMDIGFISDNIAELHKGNTCFIYIQDQIEEIKKGLKDKYNETISVKEADGYWELRPDKQKKWRKEMKNELRQI